MCGIWGYLGEDPIAVNDAYRGLCSLTERGPDDWGAYVAGTGKIVNEAALPDGDCRVFLGNRRLSILDLSKDGNQPMAVDDDLWIVYNGEVYNYREIRSDLRSNGYEFETETDTEVILKAYQEYGAACVEQFRGMFAFVIYDERTDTIFGARDRFGIKPFYFDETGDSFAFASELTSLLEANATRPELDPAGVDGFLALGYVPGPDTILADVQSLPPGSTVTYDRSTKNLAVESYWEPTFDDNSASEIRVRELLEESVELRLRSDVPVGAFLSGGLDSSTIVGMMRTLSREARENLHTYAIGFESEEYSETEFAELVADEFDTEHTSRTVTAEDVEREFEDIVAAMDQPTIDGVNTYFVSKLAADDGLKVALSGLGSDELFFGYPAFESVPRRHRAARYLYVIPDSIRTTLTNLVATAARNPIRGATGKLLDAVDGSDPFGEAYLSVRGVFSRKERADLVGDEEPVDWGKRIGDDLVETEDVRNTVSRTEITWYMRDQLLRQTDMMSMAHSLEVRVPFLDETLASYVTNVSPDEKDGGEKTLLKAAVDDIVPLDIIEREKTGFEFPFSQWLHDDLRALVDDTLAPEQLNDTPLNANVVRRIRRDYEDGDVHWSRLWAIVVLSEWISTHLTE